MKAADDEGLVDLQVSESENNNDNDNNTTSSPYSTPPEIDPKSAGNREPDLKRSQREQMC